ncbi:OmpA family protein [Pseudocnuella soli]|uniref:OmpA family protein n=1 Tax=Pseudocnuella soli TaxID=2502779 RepID=UPI0010510D06|nr:OmpA family protein [Pseudocnuella soli]
MAINLLASVRDLFTPEVTERAATQFGESSSGISKALSGVVPTVLAGFVQRAETGHADELLRDARAADDNNVLDNLGGMFSSAAGGAAGASLLGGIPGWLSQLFGDRNNSVNTNIAQFAGVREGTVQSLIGMIAPLVLSFLGREAKQKSWTGADLRGYLSNQKTSIMGALPAGLSVGNWFRSDSTVADPVIAERTVAEPVTRTEHRETVVTPTRDVEPARKSNWVLPVLLGLGAIALIAYLVNRNDDDDDDDEVMATTTMTDTSTAAARQPAAAATTRSYTKVRLPNNTELDAYQGGVEDQLVACLNDAACEANKDRWFDFDNINFETGSARLTAESNAQIANIAAILKAYPDARIKIGGYTDKVGNAEANEELSEDRAEAVMAALKAAGADKQVTDAEGYGSKFATMPETATDEERRVDRRIAVQLHKK